MVANSDYTDTPLFRITTTFQRPDMKFDSQNDPANPTSVILKCERKQ